MFALRCRLLQTGKVSILVVGLIMSGGFCTQVLGNVCQGRLLDPVNMINWSMIFPIRIGGAKFEQGYESSEASMGASHSICVCPSHFLGLPKPGIVVSFHAPLFVEEIAKTPGCLSSLGSVKILSHYDREQTELDTESSSSRWQVHWYTYPILSLLRLFSGFDCLQAKSPKQFALLYLTEIDPTWQDDAWQVIAHPMSYFYASPKAQSLCALDAMAATKGQPIDRLFWCAGSWGSIYPLTGNANVVVGRIQSANLVGAKMIERLSEMGFLSKTFGSDALCKSQPMPIWIKSIFSIDPVYPMIRHDSGVPIGAAPMVWEYQPMQSYPEYENINQVIFQEIQCCVHS